MRSMILFIRDDKTPRPGSIRKFFLPKSEGIRTEKASKNQAVPKRDPNRNLAFGRDIWPFMTD